MYQQLVNFDYWTTVAQLLNFGIQLLLFKRFLFEPVKKILEKRQLERLNKRIVSQLRDEILVTPVVKFLQPGSLPQSEGKAVRVKDLRKLS